MSVFKHFILQVTILVGFCLFSRVDAENESMTSHMLKPICSLLNMTLSALVNFENNKALEKNKAHFKLLKRLQGNS